MQIVCGISEKHSQPQCFCSSKIGVVILIYEEAIWNGVLCGKCIFSSAYIFETIKIVVVSSCLLLLLQVISKNASEICFDLSRRVSGYDHKIKSKTIFHQKLFLIIYINQYQYYWGKVGLGFLKAELVSKQKYK